MSLKAAILSIWGGSRGISREKLKQREKSNDAKGIGIEQFSIQSNPTDAGAAISILHLVKPCLFRQNWQLCILA